MSTPMLRQPRPAVVETTARPQRVGLIAARSKVEAQELSVNVAHALDVAGAEVVREENLVSGEHDPIDAIVVLGGDGLMIRAARMVPGAPLLGINFGHVGFLTLVERDGWRQALESVLAGRHHVQRGPTLDTSVFRDGCAISDGWGINDAVIRAGPQMTELELYIDGRYVNTYPGDGMIVATPQGSTAYCMAAGGPILTRGVRGFAVVPLNPHSPIRIPLVVEEEALIELVVSRNRPCWLYLDGDIPSSVELEQGDTVRVCRGEPTFALVLLDGMSFYDAIRSRFNFLVRPEAVPSRRPTP